MATKEVKKEVKPKQQEATVYIAKDPLNPYEDVQQVSINEKVYNIAKGTSVDVPLEVAKLLKETGIIDDYIIK